MRVGWGTIPLGEVYDVRDGTHDSPKYQAEGFPLITSKNLKSGQLNFDKVKYISKEDLEKINKRSAVNTGDVLFAMIGTIGNPTIIQGETDFAIKNVALFKNNETQSSKFLQYYLQSKAVIDKMMAEAKGTTQKFVGLGYLRKFPFICPPLEEQKRIVAILDEAFEGLDRARAHTEANLQNAKELFESRLKDTFIKTSSEWKTKSLVEVTSKIGSGATPRGGAASYKSEGISLVRSMNVHDRSFVTKKLAFIDDEQASKLKNVILEQNDVLLNITGASVARCCVMPDDFLPARVNQHVSILRTDTEELLPRFLCYELTSESYKNMLLGIGEEGGSTRQAITKKQIQSLEVTYPNIEEQQQIISLLEIVEKATKKLKQDYHSKLTDLDDLRQSLLQKAFAGELT